MKDINIKEPDTFDKLMSAVEGRTKAIIQKQYLSILTEILEKADDSKITYRALNDSGDNYEIYIDGELLGLLPVPFKAILTLVVDTAEKAYKRGVTNAVTQIFELQKRI